ncbi:MAG: carboxylating nicotinate-nucleotide diphosphorylase [Thaumarchaeota archaeon]|nr:carboxylating nicotinate-nucleotide diphosphorylase [Nitrososphaerota archaeon]MDD9812996.1 carboxylating nicotinate-nucleotide diphosphorylase [Nitrososphaerota archaeon]
MPHSPRAQVARFLAEDIGGGDITSALLPRARLRAAIVSREPAVVAGTEWARAAFVLRGCAARARVRDGRRARAGQAIMDVSGPARGVLSAERTALNLLSRMSGIATQTRALADAVRGTRARVYATRKTAPGLSFFDKEAVAAGGGMRHRAGLWDAVLIKDNHIAAAAASGIGVGALVGRARRRHGAVEVEVEGVRDALAAARAGATVILLDNMPPSRVRRAVAALEREGLRSRVSVEASGGIGPRNIAAYARAGVDRVSVGSITSSVRSIDMSLEARA